MQKQLLVFVWAVTLAVAQLEAAPRIWSDATGVFTVEAELVAVKSGQVHLRKSDGRVVVVPLDKLSAADRQHLQAARPQPQATNRDALQAVLSTPMDYGFVETPLSDVLNFFSSLHEAPLAVNTVALPAEKLATLTVSGKARGQTFSAALDQVLSPLELSWFATRGAILVTTQAKAQSHFAPRVYRVTAKRFVLDDVVDSITSTIAPRSWQDVGGHGAIARLAPNLLVVRQTHQSHRELAAGFKDSLVAVHGPAPAAPKGVEALSQRVACSFVKTPLSDVASFLSDQTGLDVVLDTGIDRSAPVSLRLNELPLAQLLDVLVWQQDLTWVGQQKRITLMSPAVASARPRVVNHAVAGLDRAARNLALMEVIRTAVEPASWDRVGGEGAIRNGVRPSTVVVRQPDHLQRQISQLLADLRAARRQVGE